MLSAEGEKYDFQKRGEGGGKKRFLYVKYRPLGEEI